MVWSRPRMPGFDFIAWGAACFAVAAQISLLKTGLPHRSYSPHLIATPHDSTTNPASA